MLKSKPDPAQTISFNIENKILSPVIQFNSYSQRSPDEAKRNPGEWGGKLPAFRFAPCGLHF